MHTHSTHTTRTQIPLQIRMCHDMFMLSGVVEAFGLNTNTLCNFLTTVASHHHDTCHYHNFNHVVHVLHGVWMVGGMSESVLVSSLPR